jgi:hypothetical protein
VEVEACAVRSIQRCLSLLDNFLTIDWELADFVQPHFRDCVASFFFHLSAQRFADGQFEVFVFSACTHANWQGNTVLLPFIRIVVSTIW